MGLRIGLGLGLNKQGLARFLSVDEQIQLFKQRIENDNGTFESQACLQNLINQGLFENANFVLTPNGYKAGKLYALKPDNGDLDVTWVRNGNASRINQNRLIVNEGNNVPRVDFLGGDCPNILVEPQQTNRVIHSDPTSAQLTLTLNLNEQPNDFGLGNLLQRKYVLDNENQTIEARIGVSVSTIPTDTDTFAMCFARNQDGSEVIPGEDVRFQITGGSAAVDSSFFKKKNIKDDIWLIWSTQAVLRNANATSFLFRKTTDESAKITEIAGFCVSTDGIINNYIPTTGTAVTRPSDAPVAITVPTGTTEIVEALEDGTFNTITTIPTTYTIPFGRFKYILFNGA